MALINTPNAGQTLAQTRPDINANFANIDTQFAVDHVDYNTAGAGKHEKVTLVNNAAATFAAGEMGMFNKTAAPTGIPDIWLARGTTAAFPMTGYVLGGTDAANGWTYLPSGLKMAWGKSTTGGSTNKTIIYANELTNFPGFTNANVPQVTRIANPGPTDNFVTLGNNYTNTQFIVYSSLRTTGTGLFFSWMVIGL